MRPRRLAATVFALTALSAPVAIPAQADAPSAAGHGAPHAPPYGKRPTATGYGGAVSTVDLDASRTAIEILARGGNAVDAAVAASATLGVTEPYVAALGGGGFFLYYDAKTRRVHSIDGRETAPKAMTPTSFQENGQPIPIAEAITSGLSVGVPGTVRKWEQVLDRWGSMSLAETLRPAIRVAERGFVVDEEFRAQTAVNEARFRQFTSTRDLFLPGGRLPEVGSRMRNPDLARTYRELGRRGPDWFYEGPVASEIVKTVKHPPLVPGSTLKVRPGLMEPGDLAAYRAPYRQPTRSDYRGLEVYGMAPPSSGGSTVGEALNILERFRLSGDRVTALHRYLEASRLAFADRNRYVGDPAFVDVPLRELLSDGFARERSCLIGDTAMAHPAAPGSPDGSYEPCAAVSGAGTADPYEGPQTTHLVVSDKWGNVVAYNITIEQFGGNGMVVPGRGFLLNNELTDFSFAAPPGVVDPNLPAPGKRPRSSMAPTIVLKDGRPLLALGSPGGSTIITTVLQILLNRVDFGMDLPEAVAAPRATQRNTAATLAEAGFISEYGAALRARGHVIDPFPGPPAGQIGAATALEFLTRTRVQAVAEPTRRGGGSALVVIPAR
ncbi:gamma-glutamyltransferase [Bailinhaonella thermotolerans]|uniref:Glutathione hydrolase proenzyme n=1 Tax=Bailinhaonella thermotolerans TaxID=1070861 RepID=A0A3A4ASU6_9ACTN|nr:gamma-glutamyltransferase [Bailinhaonella thermotolerans]RJL30374.1 gamma-glutamyltransferase [Bailinhaonella thermotolerans]